METVAIIKDELLRTQIILLVNFNLQFQTHRKHNIIEILLRIVNLWQKFNLDMSKMKIKTYCHIIIKQILYHTFLILHYNVYMLQL
jgi:hypothetical protein